jgi:single-strand DNA-binding protein
MAGVNKAILIGHLGKDPEVRKTTGGNPIGSFSLATSESWKDKATGERREHTDWHNIVIFNEALVKVAEQYLKKGSKVYVEGAIKTRKWTDKSNIDRFTTEIVLQAFQSKLVMLDRAERAPAPDEASYGGGEAPPPAVKPSIDDEIPF